MDVEGDELIAFFQELGKEKERKTRHLSIIKAFLDDPTKFGVDLKNIPSSSTPEEIEKRKQELAYRAELLKAVLESTEAELEALKSIAEEEQSHGKESG
ncbi:MAG: hypothetical protein OEQ18_07505 [Gammaproteobacteria bacterium]|nr:hypothetical protein [Gammaproteobacteria bacterium]